MSTSTVRWIESFSFPGTKSAVHLWNAEAAGAPGVFIVHGIGEHAERYAEVAEYLASQGFRVAAPDLPGHGLSRRDGGQTRCYAIDEMSRVCEELRPRVLGDGPWLLLTHSMGSLIGLTWLLETKTPPRRAFISAPPLALRLQVPVWKEFAARILLKLAPDLQLSNEIDPAMLSYDADNIRRYRQDRLVHSYSSSRQYDSIKRCAARAVAGAGSFAVPMFLAVGEDDPIVDPAAIFAFADALAAPVKLKALPRNKHEILNETDRRSLYAELGEWFRAT